MSKKNGVGKFIIGAGIGAGLALLFAPQDGKTTRKQLKFKLDELYDKVRNIDPEDVKEDILERIDELKLELQDLDKEKVLKIAKTQAKKISKKAEELYKIALEKGTPVVQRAADEVREAALNAAKSVVDKLEDDSKESKK